MTGPVPTPPLSLAGWRRPRWATVGSFDPERGLGTVRLDEGFELPFHCTAVADGSRRVEVGARVTVTVSAGHLGRLEAGELQPASPVGER